VVDQATYTSMVTDLGNHMGEILAIFLMFQWLLRSVTSNEVALHAVELEATTLKLPQVWVDY
jgi:hypothetical protein